MTTPVEALPHAGLPPKEPGQHRWVATGVWALAETSVSGASDADPMGLLGAENLVHLVLGCWDCQLPPGAIQPGSRCLAPGAPT